LPAGASAGAVTYDIRFGTVNPPPLIASGLTTGVFSPGALRTGTTYFWQVVAHSTGGSTTGPIWTFTTAYSLPALSCTTPVSPGGLTSCSVTDEPGNRFDWVGLYA